MVLVKKKSKKAQVTVVARKVAKSAIVRPSSSRDRGSDDDASDEVKRKAKIQRMKERRANALRHEPSDPTHHTWLVHSSTRPCQEYFLPMPQEICSFAVYWLVCRGEACSA